MRPISNWSKRRSSSTPYDIQPSNMYNMDEKGFLIGVMKKSKRIFTKSAYSPKQLLGHVQDGNREWITVLATICADGSWLPPGLIYKASTGNLQTCLSTSYRTQVAASGCLSVLATRHLLQPRS